MIECVLRMHEVVGLIPTISIYSSLYITEKLFLSFTNKLLIRYYGVGGGDGGSSHANSVLQWRHLLFLSDHQCVA